MECVLDLDGLSRAAAQPGRLTGMYLTGSISRDHSLDQQHAMFVVHTSNVSLDKHCRRV